MIRGFVLGILAGGAVSALGLGVVSQFSQAPGAAVAVPAETASPKDAVTTPQTDAPAAGPVIDPATVAPDAPQGAVVPDAPQGAVVPKGPASAPQDPASDPAQTTTPDAAPADDKGSGMAPVPEVAPSVADTQTAAPALQEPAVQEPAVPQTDATESDIAANPATDAATDAAAAPPPAAAASVADAPPVTAAAQAPEPLAPAPATDAAPGVTAVAELAPVTAKPDLLAKVAPDTPPAPQDIPAAPPELAGTSVPEPPVQPAPEPADLKIAQILPSPMVPDGPVSLPKVLADTTPVQVDPPPAPPADPKPRILTEDAPLDDAATATLAPSQRLGGDVKGVVTNRLPRIGDAATATGPDDAATRTPLVRFARAFDNPDLKPVFSIVLIDTGAPDVDRKSLAELPFPVSFAIDPLSDGAAERAAIYRAAGQEVLMLASGIPEGATAADLEVSLAALSDALPEAVAVLEQIDPVFQDNRPLATQIVPILAAQGRGLVTWDQGLNAADQVARRNGLASAMVFRSLDSEAESVSTIRRYLDRAAFRAAQDGRVVVVGTTRPETVQALTEWGAGGRSSSVALAPISAALVVN